jgi:hypothetical protein
MYSIGVKASYLVQYYGNFKKAQKTQFASCFWAEGFIVSSERRFKKIKHIAFNDYDVLGEIVFLNNKIWVVDFGKFMAYAFPQTIKQYEGKVKVGDFIEGKACLEIDMFPYLEYHHKEEGIQPLIYTWNVDKIQKIVAPIDDIQLGKNKDRWSTTEIEQTKCLYDDNGMALYIFQCELLNDEPKYEIEIHNSTK